MPYSKYSSKTEVHSFQDKDEYIGQLSALLVSKDFRERIKGIDQLVADCQDNPGIVIHSLFPVRKTSSPLVNAHYLTLALIPFETTSCPVCGNLFPVSPRSPRCLTPSKTACRRPTVR